MAAQLKDHGRLSTVQLVRPKMFAKIAADCRTPSAKPEGLIKFVNKTMASTKHS